MEVGESHRANGSAFLKSSQVPFLKQHKVQKWFKDLELGISLAICSEKCAPMQPLHMPPAVELGSWIIGKVVLESRAR